MLWALDTLIFDLCCDSLSPACRAFLSLGLRRCAVSSSLLGVFPRIASEWMSPAWSPAALGFLFPARSSAALASPRFALLFLGLHGAWHRHPRIAAAILLRVRFRHLIGFFQPSQPRIHRSALVEDQFAELQTRWPDAEHVESANGAQITMDECSKFFLTEINGRVVISCVWVWCCW